MDGLPVEINASREVVHNTLLISDSVHVPSSSQISESAPAQPTAPASASLINVNPATAGADSNAPTLEPSPKPNPNPNPNHFLIHGGIYHSATRLKQLLDEKLLLPNTFAKYPVSAVYS